MIKRKKFKSLEKMESWEMLSKIFSKIGVNVIMIESIVSRVVTSN